MFIRSTAAALRHLPLGLRRASLVAGLVLLSTPGIAQATGPAISVAPTSGDPGAGLTVTGSGWTVGDTVEVEIGGSQVCQLVADSSGNLSGNQSNGCQVPSGLTAGSQSLTAQDLTDGVTQATGSAFTITPFASFTAPASVAYGSPVNLNASSSQGAVTRYLWDFGDGTTASTATPTTSHTYSKVGGYVITLTVVDSSGNTDTTGQSVSVTGSAPTASFSAPAEQPTGTSLNFDGTGSSTPNAGANITSYDWNWGDGTPDGSGATPIHSYTAAGSYSVTLTVTDSAGMTGSVTHTVVVDDRSPVASFSTPGPQAVGTPVAFDGSTSSDPDGTIVSYDWNWGDGTGDGTTASPSHTFSTVGTFPVTLTVTDNSGNTSSVQHDVTITGSAPTASFPQPPEKPTGTALSFDGTGSSTPNAGATITSYDWSWGDGTPDGAGAKPTHSYTTAGTYTVTLTVRDSAGQTGSIAHDVIVDDRSPVAAFTHPGSQAVGTSAQFDGSTSSDPDGTISSYDWNWGDGTSDGSGATPSHTFTTAGTFTVTLTVTDNSGNTNSVEHDITITAGTPTAAFTAPAAQPTGTTLNFDGTGSSTPNAGATITSYSWSFGDGASSTLAQPTHSYATAGTYAVTLTVTDSAGKTGSATHNVTVDDRPPVAVFTAPTGPQPAGVPIAFDGSTSNDPDGRIVSYDWKWGDGTGDGTTASPTHTYTSNGTFHVKLTVTDNSGKSNSLTQDVTISGNAATAAFTPPAEQPTGTVLSFVGTGSSSNNSGGRITSYDWNWGDGTPDGSGPTATHSYARPGMYTVTLTVTDSANNQGFVSHTVTVDPRQPVAAFNPTAATVLAGSNVAFDGTQSSDPDGTITGYSWNFGDGGSSTGPQPGHKYFQTGTFSVKLTVTDSFGQTSSVTHQLTVIAPPPMQTLILTPVASPTILKWTRVSATHSGIINLGERLFCPGPGPSCTAYIVATSKALLHAGRAAGVHRRALAGTAQISIAPNGNAEVAFKLSRRAFGLLRRQHRLPVHVKITVVRGNLSMTKAVTLLFVG